MTLMMTMIIRLKHQTSSAVRTYHVTSSRFNDTSCVNNDKIVSVCHFISLCYFIL